MRSPTDGRPYYCNACGCGWNEMMACEDGECVPEPQERAERRKQSAEDERALMRASRRSGKVIHKANPT